MFVVAVMALHSKQAENIDTVNISDLTVII